VIVIDRLVAIHSGYALPRMTVVFQARIIDGVFRPSAEVDAYRFCPRDALGHLLPAEQQAVRQALGG
jgi:hypothetical protein